MAHLWQLDGTAWTRLRLDGNYFALRAQPESPLQPESSLPANGAPAALGRYDGPEQTPLWVLFGRDSAVRVNGRTLLAGIAVLRDRDEILLGGRTRLYFSTEELAKVEPFPGGPEPVFCARCKQPIQPGTPAVRCPSCHQWTEQSPDKPCWTYAPACPMCVQSTASDAGLRWTPEEM